VRPRTETEFLSYPSLIRTSAAEPVRVRTDQPLVVYSVVIPVFNEAEVLPALYSRLTTVMAALGQPYEIVFVNDGSSDGSLTFVSQLRAHDSRVRIVSLSRNFGHQVAITAGLDYSSGAAVIVMDADLQDPPETIPALIAQWHAGYDVVFAVRGRRQGESLFKRTTAALFYRLLQRLTSTQIPLDAGDFRLMSRRAVDALKPIRERHRFVRGLVGWIGFKHTRVQYVRDARYAGETKYPVRKMVGFAMNGIASFSFMPLQLATYLGFVVSFCSFGYIVYAIELKLFTDRAVQGWASLMVAMLFLGGVQLISLGIIGEYIGRIYDEVKQRPLYVVDVLDGFDNPQVEETPSHVKA
jgi:glycosyltransferase involved in cell wall biosynthesis